MFLCLWYHPDTRNTIMSAFIQEEKQMFREMRRKGQQLSQEECVQILRAATSGVLAVFGDDGYPYTVPVSHVYADGKIAFHAEEIEGEPKAFELALRIPAWAASGCIDVRDGEAHRTMDLPDTQDGYEGIVILHPESFRVTLTLAMPARLTAAHPMVEEDRGRAAVERGPLVYCLEAADLPDGESVRDVRLDIGGVWTPEKRVIDGREVMALSGELLYTPCGWGEALYRTIGPETVEAERIGARLIPYFAWNNRNPDRDEEMAVFLPVNY